MQQGAEPAARSASFIGHFDCAAAPSASARPAPHRPSARRPAPGLHRTRLKRGAVVMQSRAGLLQPVRVDPRKQRGFGAAAKASRTGDSKQMGAVRRMAEHQGIGDMGDRPPPPPPPPPHLRRGHPQDLAARRQMQKELQEAHDLEPGMGMGRARGGPPRPMMVPVDRLPPEMARQLAQGPITLQLGGPPPHLHPGYFPPGAPKHGRRAVGAMAHLASPVRVSSGPTGVSPRELPPAVSPREHLSTPRNLAHSPPATVRGFAEDNSSPRYSSDAEKTPRSAAGRQEGVWKASPRPSAEAPTNSPRGDAAAAPEGRRGVPRDRGEDRLLRNLNLKAVENKGGRLPDRAKLLTNTAGPAPNDATAGRVPHQGGGAIYQMDRKGQFGRGAGVGPHSQGVGARPGQYPGPQQQQMPKINPARAPADTPRMASQRKPPTVLAKKTTLSPPKPPPGFSPALLIASPATSPMNSPRPSLMTKNTISGKSTNAANASPGSSPTRVPKSASPRNSPARTYVITPEDSPTALPVPLQKTPARSPQATSAANVSAKLQMDSPVPQTKASTTAGKDRKGKYQNPKTRLSAGGDLQTAKGRPKIGPYRFGAAEAASPAAPTAQIQPSREGNEPRLQLKEPLDFNKGQLPIKASPLVRKLTKTSLLPVQNPSTPRSVVSQHLPEEEHGKIGNTMAKQAEGTPRRPSAGEGNRRFPPPARVRKGAITGTAHTEGPREATRARPPAGRLRRGPRGKDRLDVAAALPDTSGNYTSAVHQWLRQSHYKVISPQQYRQHETIQEETVKQTGLAEKAMAFKDERPPKPAAPEPEKEKEKASPQLEKGGRRGRPAVVRKHKDVTALPKMAAATAAARAGKKASKAAAAAAAAVASVESGTVTSKRKAAAKRGGPKGITAKGRGARRRKDKDKAKLPPSACPRLRPKVGPAGDSGDLSTSSEDSSFLSASDEAMNEQSTMC